MMSKLPPHMSLGDEPMLMERTSNGIGGRPSVTMTYAVDRVRACHPPGAPRIRCAVVRLVLV